MRIVVTGLHGQVVTALAERTGEHSVMKLGRPELDLADSQSIKFALSATKADVIISAAAYTAVDKAETEADLAFAINATGAGALAQAAAEMNIPIVHLSTDYVFDGKKTGAYREEDATAPLGVYGASKLAGEKLVAATCPNHAILRTAWVYSPFGANFLRTMLRLAETRDEIRVVADQFGNPTSALDIADAVLAVAANLHRDADPALRGTFHMAGRGDASWADFAATIFTMSAHFGGPTATVVPIPTAEYPTPSPRPENSRLNSEKLLMTHGVVLPAWQASARQVIQLLTTPKTTESQ